MFQYLSFKCMNIYFANANTQEIRMFTCPSCILLKGSNLAWIWEICNIMFLETQALSCHMHYHCKCSLYLSPNRHSSIVNDASSRIMKKEEIQMWCYHTTCLPLSLQLDFWSKGIFETSQFSGIVVHLDNPSTKRVNDRVLVHV